MPLGKEDIVLIGIIAGDEVLAEHYEDQYDAKHATSGDFLKTYPSAKIDIGVGIGGILLGAFGGKIGLNNPFYRMIALIIGAQHLGRLARKYWYYSSLKHKSGSSAVAPATVALPINEITIR